MFKKQDKQRLIFTPKFVYIHGKQYTYIPSSEQGTIRLSHVHVVVIILELEMKTKREKKHNQPSGVQITSSVNQLTSLS